MSDDAQIRMSTAHEDTPPPSVGSRLHFVWFAIVATLWTVPMAIIQLVSHRFAPTAQNFKSNAGASAHTSLPPTGSGLPITEPASPHGARPSEFVRDLERLLDILASSAARPYPFSFVAKAELAKGP